MAEKVQALIDPTLKGVLESIWQSEDAIQEARVQSEALGVKYDDPLREILRVIVKNSSAEVRQISVSEENRHWLLWLIMMSVFHSDSLTFLPIDLRDARYLEWASVSGFPPEIVRAAAAMGPYHLGYND